MLVPDSPWLDLVARSLTLTIGGLLLVIGTVRLVGLRSFSKMTAFDFVATVATGSLLAAAGTATSWSAYAQTLLAMAALFLAQVALAWLRKSKEPAREALDNSPLLLMRDGGFLEDALTESRVTKSDVIAKLREANVLEFSAVRAVVLEATGDISVLHGVKLSDDLLDGVRTA